ncbi:N-acetylmuramoyl-L-alanine amidase [Candidatus Oscillochloris fontis]|uniref:N-acetylmuramoyl-L-alanine amidase n=1 Tax=Candidatus Oscillochloris fontis TaxID=2496868 RepID=UPI00101CBC86|nr:N-acetylmuramoyl-L-alanine amidase [Candidatus Oscillochloris fontis]
MSNPNQHPTTPIIALLAGLLVLLVVVGVGLNMAAPPSLPTDTVATIDLAPIIPTSTSLPQHEQGLVVATLQPDRGIPADPTPTVHIPVPKPAIVSRAAWGAAEAVGTFIPLDPREITLHHEGVLFDGTIPASQYIRQVQRWSIDNRKWPDIPYHFLIDLEGTIYEGRTLAAQGSSNTDYDLQGHIQVAVLGKYDAGEQEPNPTQITAIIELMAWIADTYHLAPDTIHGHRDFIPLNARGEHIDPRTGSRITCPGDNLYRYLEDGTIQRGVAAQLGQ